MRPPRCDLTRGARVIEALLESIGQGLFGPPMTAATAGLGSRSPSVPSATSSGRSARRSISEHGLGPHACVALGKPRRGSSVDANPAAVLSIAAAIRCRRSASGRPRGERRDVISVGTRRFRAPFDSLAAVPLRHSGGNDCPTEPRLFRRDHELNAYVRHIWDS